MQIVQAVGATVLRVRTVPPYSLNCTESSGFVIDGLDLMADQWELTPAAFETLLAWLDTDRERAGKRYEHIRGSLIRIFVWRGCREAEDMADTTINRVARKFPELAQTYVGEPELYFYGVAKKVALECRKQEVRQVLLPVVAQSDDTKGQDAAAESERRHECLEQCLLELNDNNRELITRYYQRERQEKVDSRKKLSGKLGISPLALRVRAHRLRNLLYECMQKCLALETT